MVEGDFIYAPYIPLRVSVFPNKVEMFIDECDDIINITPYKLPDELFIIE